MLSTLSTMLPVPGDTLLPALWLLGKATALLVIALSVTLVMQRTSAVSRHLVWFASLAALLLIPVVATLSPVQWAILPSALQRQAASAPSTVSTLEVDAGTQSAGTGRVGGRDVIIADSQGVSDQSAADKVAPSSTPPEAAPSVAVMLLGAWLSVALVLGGWLAAGLFLVSRIVRRATPLDNTEWSAPLYEIADRLSLNEAPRLMRSADILMPFACGLRRPTIVLPQSADQWSSEQRSAVLLHEMAHIKRRDIVGHTVGRFACALYWFHPLVWTAAKRLRAESERACDDLALLCGARASDYAEHLLDIVSHVKRNTTPSVALAMATRSEFEGRMLAILDPALRRAAPTRRQSTALVSAVAIMALLIGVAVPVSSVAAGTELTGGEVPGKDDAQPPVASQRPAPSPLPVAAPAPASAPQDPRAARDPRDPMFPVVADTVELMRAAEHLTRGTEKAVARGMTSALLAMPNADLQRAFASRVDSSERATLLTRVLRTEKSAELRRVAAWGLQDFAERDAVADALALALRSDTSSAVREMAAWALAGSGHSPRAQAALQAAVRADSSAKVQSTAIWALGEQGDAGESTLSVLSAALSHRDANVRELAAWSLGSIAPSKAPRALLSALRDEEAAVRATAAWALHEIGDDAAVGSLDAALRGERVRTVQLAEMRALAVLGESAVDALKRLIDDPDPDVRATAIRALAGGNMSHAWPQPRPRPRPFP